MAEELPLAIREEILQLAREERTSPFDGRKTLRAEREKLLTEYGFSSRFREDEGGVVLVCFPTSWLKDGKLDRESVSDLDRAVELPITGSDDPATWREIARENERIAEAVNNRHGETHGKNAASFADFMNNHRARPIHRATEDDIAEFLTDYFPRNVWPSPEQKHAIDESIRLAMIIAEDLSD